MFQDFKTIFLQELKLYYRRKSDIINTLAFFLLVIILFPIGVGPEPSVLKVISFGVIWVGAIFASIFGVRGIFEPDFEDGTLDQYLTSPIQREILVLAKIAANWAAYCLPIVILSPIAAAMFGFSFEQAWILSLALLFATPVFVMIGAIGAAVSLGAKRGRLMLHLLVIPLYIPVLIFGVNTSYIFINEAGVNYSSNLMIMGGLLLFSIPLSAFAAAKSISA